MQISVQLYSVRESFAADPAATLRRLAELGLRSVEPFGLTEHAETLRPLLAEFGLDAPSSHVALLDAEDPVRVFAVAAGLGVGTVIQPYWDRQAWDHEGDIRATAEHLNALTPLASEAGIRVGYHNHEFEARPIFDGRCGLDLLVDHLDPRVVLELDTFWCAVGGTDPAELLGRLGQRVQLVHLKDGPLQGDTRKQQVLGQGEMDIASILRAAPWLETGVIEFDDHEGDIFEAIGRSVTHLTELSHEEQA